MNDLRRERGSQGIEHSKDVDDLLGNRTADRTQMAGRGEGHADQAKSHTTDGALQGDDSHAAADVHKLVHFFERVVHDDDSGGLGGDIAVLTNGHANGGSHHGGRVVDPIADIEGLGLGGFSAAKRFKMPVFLIRISSGLTASATLTPSASAF